MSKVVSFISRKGGTGKTTNAINIATALNDMGFEVVLIETDINYSLSSVREKELQENPEVEGRFIELVQTEETSVVKLIKHYQKNMVDFIIVDSAANTSAYGTNRISAHSDIVVVPTSLSMNEISVGELTLQDILPALEDNPALQIVLLPNRIHFLTLQETVVKSLEHLNVPVLDFYVPDLKYYTYISTLKPAKGYREVANRILKLLVKEQTKANTSFSATEAVEATDSALL